MNRGKERSWGHVRTGFSRGGNWGEAPWARDLLRKYLHEKLHRQEQKWGGEEASDGVILGKVWGTLAQSYKRTQFMKWCLGVCPDLAKRMGFRALLLISSSLKFIPGRSKLSGTSSLKRVWAKHFQGALNHLSKGGAGTSVQSKSWVGVEAGRRWESREAPQCQRGSQALRAEHQPCRYNCVHSIRYCIHAIQCGQLMTCSKGSTPNGRNQTFHFNKIPIWFLQTLKLEKHWYVILSLIV